MSCIAVIPARYGSSRFPGKPLVAIAGKPMIQWVVEQVTKARSFDRVIVATDDQRILDAVAGFGGEAMMTGSHHESGSDRVWEVASNVPDAEFIFNVQGDEPLIDPLCLEEAASWLKGHHEKTDIVTLKAPIVSLEEREDSNVVKVVTSTDGQALYFSRAAIPHVREADDAALGLEHAFRHVGLYGYTRRALERFVNLPVSLLERLEKLEQLRALEAGFSIQVLPISEAPIGVDTPADLARVEARLSGQLI